MITFGTAELIEVGNAMAPDNKGWDNGKYKIVLAQLRADMGRFFIL